MMSNFQSNFVFGLQGNLYQAFINIVATPIIREIVGSNDYDIIDFDKHLSSFDFDHSKRKDSIFPEFYLNFLGDIKKCNDSIYLKKKVCITLDESLCTDICLSTGRKITTIKLGGIELVYFIYFDIKEFFDFSYNFNPRKLDNFHVINSEENGKELKINQGTEAEILNDTVQNVRIQDNKILEKINPSKFFSGKPENDEINIQREYTERVGYINNINQERGLIFIHDSKDGNSGFPILYRDFPDAQNHTIGTAIRAFGYFYENRFYVENYDVIDSDELPFQIMKLNGTLKYHEDSKYAIIKTGVGGVYTTLDLIRNYEANIVYQVECVAIESYNHKRQENGWRAIFVENG